MSDRNLSLSLRLIADSAKFVQGLAQGQQGVKRFSEATRTEFQQLSKARELLGVRPERTIQREIQRTEAAYARLKRSGTLSWREQAMAADGMRRKVEALNQEMGKFTRMQKLAAVAGGVTGLVAAGHVLRPGAERAMSYDLRLAHMANTAFADRDTAGRKSGARELNTAIVGAVRKGGGSRDSAAGALDFLIASGVINVKDAAAMLPTLMKDATATGGDANEFAAIAVRAVQNMKIKPGDLPKVLDYGIAAGQAGGFEIKDMSKWLPQQMAMASQLGLTGPAGFAKLAALNQASVITAGTKDEAGNNLVNLLAKINSADTAKDAKKLGINLPEYLAKNRAKGVDAVDAFVGLVDGTVSKQPAWKKLQKQLAGAKDGTDRKDTLESMSNIIQASGVGQLVQDRQALMALIAVMNSRKYLDEVQGKTLAGEGSGDRNFSVVSDTASFQTERASNESQIAQQQVMDGLMPAIKSVSGGFADMAQKFPELATATVAATAALTALAAGAGGAALGTMLPGGGGAAGGAGGAIVRGMKTAGGFLIKRGLPLLGAWEGGQYVGGQINEGLNWGVSKLTGKPGNTLGGALYDWRHPSQTSMGPDPKVNGEIRIRVDQEGRLTSVRASSKTNGLELPVDVGPAMGRP